MRNCESRTQHRLGLVTHTCNPSTREAEAESCIVSQAELHRKTLSQTKAKQQKRGTQGRCLYLPYPGHPVNVCCGRYNVLHIGLSGGDYMENSGKVLYIIYLFNEDKNQKLQERHQMKKK